MESCPAVQERGFLASCVFALVYLKSARSLSLSLLQMCISPAGEVRLSGRKGWTAFERRRCSCTHTHSLDRASEKEMESDMLCVVYLFVRLCFCLLV